MDQVVAAIADPVRREILELVHDRPMTAGAIADRFAISRPAVSRHLRVLRECGLVADTSSGRHRVYRATPARLAEVSDWIARFGAGHTWSARLDALETEVHRTVRERRTTTTRQETA